MELTAVVENIRRIFVAENCPAAVLFDKSFLAENAEPPRVVFVPTRDTYSTATQIQAAGIIGATPMSFGTNPRPLFTRTQRADVHIWAKGDPQTDPCLQVSADYLALGQLINQVARCVYQTGPFNNRVTGGETDQRTLIVREGLVYTMTIEIDTPIIDVVWGETQTWTEQAGVVASITVEVAFPDGQQETEQFTTIP